MKVLNEFSCKRGIREKQKTRGGVILIPRGDSLTLCPNDITPSTLMTSHQPTITREAHSPI